MPELTLNTPLGFIGLGLLVYGVFLVLASFKIVRLEKVKVKPGKPTWIIGILMAIAGIILLMKFEPINNKTAPITSTPEILETNTDIVVTSSLDIDPYDLLRETTTWPLVLNETFDTNNTGWNLDGWDDESLNIQMEISDGRFNWSQQVYDNTWYRLWEIAPIDTYSDIYLTAKFKRLSGPKYNSYYGLIFRRNGYNLYQFTIDDYGQYNVKLYKDDKSKNLVGPTNTTQVNPNSYNQLTVITNGPDIYLYINNNHIKTISDSTLASGNVGFRVGVENPTQEEIVFYFDDFILRTKPNK